MSFFNFLFKPVRYTPLLTTQRWKVRIFPSELLGDFKYEKPKLAKSSLFINVFSMLHRKDITFAKLKHWYKWKKIVEMREDQRYMPERHQSLGPDLATTHFLTLRGGKVRFVGNDKWITLEDIDKLRIPSFYVPGFFIEEIDVSGTRLCYEGFDNLIHLFKLKKLHLRNCPFIDDWCLGRSHIFANTLEYLDLSGCHLITERGICALHPLKKLKTLVINDTPNIRNKELVSLLLQDIIPDCEIIGVDFRDPVLLKRIENFTN